MKELVFNLKRTRIPLIIMFIIVLIATAWELAATVDSNRPVNSYLEHQHTNKVIEIHHNQNRIFKIRAQMSAMSDQHMMLLLNDMRSAKRTALTRKPAYLKLTERMMKANNNDSSKIEDLQDDIYSERHLAKKDHPASPTKNILHTRGGVKVFDHMTKNGAAFIILLFFDLVIIWKIAKFKDDLYKKDLGE